MGSTKTILKRATAYALAFVMAFSMLFTGNNVVTTNAAATVTKLTVKKSKVTIDLSKSSTKTVKVTVKGSNKKFTAKSSKKSVATVKVVKKTVVITGKKKGTAKITVTTKGKNSKNKKLKKTIKVTVKGTAPATTTEPTTQQPTTQAPTTEQPTKPEDKYTNVTINTSSGSNTITPGTPVTLTVPVDEADKSLVKWTSSNPDVATVDSNGTVTAGTLAGPVTISATINGKEIAKVTMEVPSVAVTGISVTTKEKELTVNSTYPIETVFTPENASNKKVTFESDNTSAAIVSAEGVVTAKAPGEATITVTTVDGGFKDSIKIIVKESSVGVGDGLTISLTDDSLKEYWDTSKESPSFVTLAGKDATISVKLTDKGEALGGKAITLRVTPLYGNAAGMYELDGNKSRDTNEKTGVANFPLLLANRYSEVKPMDGLFESYKIQASLTEDSSVTATATISFASVGINGVEVVNGVEKDYDPLVPGTNAVESDAQPVVSVMSRNGLFGQEYVTSQQVGHTVTFKASPFIQLPASETEVKKGDYENVINFSSGLYGTYNNEDNTTTTKIIEEIPAGLEWANLKFDQLSISEFTKLVVRFYEKDVDNNKTDVLLKEYVITSDKIDEDAQNMQIPVQDNQSIYAVIALISEGQINLEKNAGFTVAKIVGAYSTKQVEQGTKKTLNGKVTWSKDESFDRSANSDVNLTKAKAQRYIQDESFIKDGYEYSYNVPSFPYVGNAIIKVKDTTQSNKVVAYYTYPIRHLVNEDDVYQNTNTISNFNYWNYGFAVQVASNEYTNMVGSIQPNGNYVTVSSGDAKTGFTAIKATFDLSEYGVEATSEYDVHTSVQWAPEPDVDEEVEAVDYYALKGQSVNVVAQLVDKNENPVSTKNGSTVSLYYEDGEVDFDEQSGFVEGDLNLSTDPKGRLMFTLTDGDDSLLLNRLTAKSKEYRVKLYVGATDEFINMDDDQKDEFIKNKLVEVATIHWVDLGLEFVDQVDVDDDPQTSDKDETKNSIIVDSIAGRNMTIPSDRYPVDLNRKTGTNWMFGLKTIAASQFIPIEDNQYVRTTIYVSDVEGVVPKFENTNEVEDFVDNNDGSFKIKNKTLGITNVTGKLTGDTITRPENIKFTITKRVMVYDENDGVEVTEEKIGDYYNVGTGVSSVSASISLNINWVENELKPSIKVAYEGQQDKDTVVPVYINAQDINDNALAGKKVTFKVMEGSDIVMSSDDLDADTLITGDDGKYRFEIPAPGTATKYTISATVEDVSVKSVSITYVANQNIDDFYITEAKLDKNAKTITVTVNNAINEKSPLSDKMFNVTKENGEAEPTIYTISSVEKTANNKIVIHLAEDSELSVETSSVKLTIGVDGDSVLKDTYNQLLYSQTIGLTE
ncbi:MAG: Ig-like domain-containing protein [Lachnospiraceae bacterium]|nr:Ig-like domain-containing protein [Lachnospiraceae bacterium]